MRLLIKLVFLLLISSTSYSQLWKDFQGKDFRAEGLWATKKNILPSDTVSTKQVNAVAIINGVFYIADGVKWRALSSGGGSSIPTYPSDSTRWEASITSMSYNSANGVLTGSRHNGTTSTVTIDLTSKLNVIDTANMLLAYLRKADTSGMLLPYLRKADTTTLSNRINSKLNTSDTAAMLANYLRVGSIASVDSTIYSTRAWRQKGDDSVASLIPLRIRDSLNAAHRVRAAGSDGVQIQNLSGNTVATFGTANTTNASIVGALTVNGSLVVRQVDSLPTTGYTTRGKAQNLIDSLNGALRAVIATNTALIAELNTDTTFTTALRFDKNYNVSSRYNITGAVAFTLNTTGYKINRKWVIYVVANGSNKPTFSSAYSVEYDGYENSAGNVMRYIITATGNNRASIHISRVE